MKATLLEKSLEKSFRTAQHLLVAWGLLYERRSKPVPGRLSGAQAQKNDELAMKFLDIIMEVPRGQVRTAKLAVLREGFPAPVVQGEEDNNGMIRFDMKFPLVVL